MTDNLSSVTHHVLLAVEAKVSVAFAEIIQQEISADHSDLDPDLRAFWQRKLDLLLENAHLAADISKAWAEEVKLREQAAQESQSVTNSLNAHLN